MSDETLLIVSIALCLLMVWLATLVGFSPALGAFIMGSILAETTKAEKIEHLVKSVKDLFGAVFFVSVGMLIDPSMIWEHIGPVILISLVTAVGKIISTSSGSLISGQSLRTSVQSGLSLSQIGEFSFIIANLGLSLNVTSSFLYPVTVAVSAITTFTTPYLIKYSGKFYSWLEKRLPDNWINSLNQYRSTTQMITTSGDWKVILRAYAYNLIIHSVIIISIIFLSTHYLNPWIQKRFADNKTGEIVTVAISLLSIAPFIWALSVRRIKEEYYSRLWQNKKLSRWPLIGMDIVRVLLGILFAGFLILQFLSSLTSILIAFGLIAVILIYFSTRLQSFYNHLEYRFLRNLNEREAMIVKKPDIVPWDAHLVELIVSPESSVIGKTLQQLAVREQYGVNIAQIRRGKHTIINPGRDEKLYPFDHILVIGTDEQLMLLKQLIEATTEIEHHETEPIVLQKIDVDNTFPLKSLSIRSSGIREDARALVVGIERDGKRILNPDSSMVFSEGDIVWVVGNPKRLQKFIQTKANAAKSH